MRSLILLTFFLSLLTGSAGAVAPVSPSLPLWFVAGRGPSPSYEARGAGYGARLSAGNATLTVPGEAAPVRLRLVGGSPTPQSTPLQPLPAKLNDLRGSDPHRWRRNVTLWGKISYRDVYPGIDLVYYGTGRKLEYDFVVRPGADPRAIRLTWDGAQRVSHQTDGALLVHLKGGASLCWQKPVLYQTAADGTRQAVPGRYARHEKRSVVFAIGKYDRTRPLIIDPVLAYSTFLGGRSADYAQAVATDAAGNVSVAVTTNSADFPGAAGTRGYYDIMLLRFSPGAASLLGVTLVGGAGDDQASALAYDPSGSIYIGGTTASTDFPATAGVVKPHLNSGSNYDGFVCKLNASGSTIQYATYLGGTASDYVQGLAVDASGSAYVCGITNSSTFPVTAGAAQTTFGGVYDAFVTKLNPSATALTYSTFLGGSDYENGCAIAVDSAGCAYVTGESDSANFPVTAGAVQPLPGDDVGIGDAFVTKLNSSGTGFAYSTFLGGEGSDYGTGIAVDASGSAFVCGMTGSWQFPVTAGAFRTQFLTDAYTLGFVTRLDQNGQNLIYSTYLGGGAGSGNTGGDDYATAIALDSAGTASVTGWTDSPSFPTTANAPQTALGGGFDAFLSRFSADGTTLLFSTFWGGAGDDNGAGIAPDGSGGAWVCGEADSIDAPTTAGAAQTAAAGGGDAFLFHISPSAWKTADVGGGADGLSRTLWTNSDGRACLRTADSAGHLTNGAIYGPFAGWTAQRLATGTNNVSRLLWTRTDGAASFWSVDAAGATFYSPVYGPYAGWTATGIAAGADGGVRLLWTRADGAASFWTVGASGAIAYSSTYGPYAGWSASELTTDAIGGVRLLWTRTDGAASFWTVGANGAITYSPTWGPFTGWAAHGIGTNGSVTRLLWTNVDGHMSSWNVGANGSTSYGPTYGPYTGWTATRGTVGADGTLRVMWNNPNGQGGLWLLDGSGTAGATLSIPGL